MNQPTVCAIMLTADRLELAKRAVECFRAQTYQNKRLLVWDTGELNIDFDNTEDGDGSIAHIPAQAYRDPKPTIGALRNEALGLWNEYPIICHWDDDDWSHPNRIAEQVALLEASRADAVGYNEMLFWRKQETPSEEPDIFVRDQAWLFTGPTILGTSLCYWRSAWEKRPFPAKSYGEDTEWLRGVKSKGITSIKYLSTTKEVEHSANCDCGTCGPGHRAVRIASGIFTPRMVARIHKGNTGHQSGTYSPKKMLDHPRQWKRVPEWDSYCKGVCE